MGQSTGASTLAWAGLATSSLSAVEGIYGAYMQGRALKAAAKYNKRQAEFQSTLFNRQSDKDIEYVRKSYAKQIAEGRTKFASGGVRVGEGSEMDWENDMVDHMVDQIVQISDQTKINVWDLKTGAALSEMTARAKANANMVSAFGGATSTLASGVLQWGRLYQYDHPPGSNLASSWVPSNIGNQASGIMSAG